MRTTSTRRSFAIVLLFIGAGCICFSAGSGNSRADIGIDQDYFCYPHSYPCATCTYTQDQYTCEKAQPPQAYTWGDCNGPGYNGVECHWETQDCGGADYNCQTGQQQAGNNCGGSSVMACCNGS